MKGGRTMKRTLGEYIDWLVAQVQRLEPIDLKVEGATDEEKAASLVQAMMGAGLAQTPGAIFAP